MTAPAVTSVPLPDVHASLAELTRALDELGSDGLAVETNTAGIYLGNARYALKVPGRDAYYLFSLRKVEVFTSPAPGFVDLLTGHRMLHTVGLITLSQPAVSLRSYTQTRRGRSRWPALELTLDRLIAASAPTFPAR